jgi:hypothetical protein
MMKETITKHKAKFGLAVPESKIITNGFEV